MTSSSAHEVYMIDEARRGTRIMNKKSALPMHEAASPSGKTLDYGTNPAHLGRMTKPDGYACITGPCGDTDEIFLRIQMGKIKDARFITDGCVFTKAACNTAAHLAIGKPIHQCLHIDQDAILEHLGDLPDSHVHCALLAATTLSSAINSYVLCDPKTSD
jgi:nitrogen fixation NifU-like protein